MDYLEPWVRYDAPNNGAAEKELQNELSKMHVLYELSCNALAHRIDRDDVLFQLNDETGRVAVVHLTYSGKSEKSSEYPKTVVYTSLEEWATSTMVMDSKEYQGLAPS